jgi:hypothetical protein
MNIWYQVGSDPILTNNMLYYNCSLHVFRHHLYIPQELPDDRLSAPKHLVSQIIKTFVCVTVTPPFLFISTTNRMQHYKFGTIHIGPNIDAFWRWY